MSEMKPLLMVKDNAVIQAAYDEMMVVKKRLDERAMFVEKQIESIKKEKNDSIDAFWVVAEKEMLEKKIVEKSEPFCLEHGVIYAGEEQNPMHELLSKLFGKR